jgi:hypothetical protein
VDLALLVMGEERGGRTNVHGEEEVDLVPPYMEKRKRSPAIGKRRGGRVASHGEEEGDLALPTMEKRKTK